MPVSVGAAMKPPRMPASTPECNGNNEQNALECDAGCAALNVDPLRGAASPTSHCAIGSAIP
eukprot:328533-Rhodomonas_salina.1